MRPADPALLHGLVSRLELKGLRVIIVDFDSGAGRCAVRLHASGECIRVKVANLKASIFDKDIL